MKNLIGLLLALLCVTTLDVQAQVKVQPKNILLICIDDLRPELQSFGVNYIHSPNIDALAKKGRPFFHHYVNAPSCGPSRYTLLTGMYGPPNNNALFFRAEKESHSTERMPLSMPAYFRNHNYTTVSVGKVSHHPGGRGGSDWNDSTIIEMPGAWDRHLMPVGPWLHPRGAMHGLAHGEIRKSRGTMAVYQSEAGEDDIYPDGLIVNQALEELEVLTKESEQPFFLAVGIIRPHLPFGAPKKYLDLYRDKNLPSIPNATVDTNAITWHPSGEFMQYQRWGKDPREDSDFATEVRRYYAACVSYADAQVGKIIAKLKETGADQNTIVVLWGDHGWNLGEHGIWGKHNLFNVALRSPLIIVDPSVVSPGQPSQAVVETVDLFPTLCDLTGTPKPNNLVGQSLIPQLQNYKAKGHHAFAYRSNVQSIRTERYRLILSEKGQVELFDHKKDPNESQNIADKKPKKVNQLKQLLEERSTLRRNQL